MPLSKVYVSETSTDKVPNASPTAASASSDMYGGAVLDACNQINARLQPFREKLAGRWRLEGVGLAGRAVLDRGGQVGGHWQVALGQVPFMQASQVQGVTNLQPSTLYPYSFISLRRYLYTVSCRQALNPKP